MAKTIGKRIKHKLGPQSGKSLQGSIDSARYSFETSGRLVYVFTCAYGVSFGPVAWVLPSEVFPLSVRSKGVALSTASNWLNNCEHGEMV